MSDDSQVTGSVVDHGDLNPRSTLGLLTRPQAAAVLGITTDTLRKWNVQRKGPASIKMGLRRYYKLTSIRKWVDDQEAGWGPMNER